MEWEFEWSVLDMRDCSPDRMAGEEERLEGGVWEDEEGGMPLVDEPWDICGGSAGAGGRGNCT